MSLKARGVKFLEPEPETYPFGLRATAVDPDGNPVAYGRQENEQ